MFDQSDLTPPTCDKQSEYTGSVHTEVEDLSLKYMNGPNVFAKVHKLGCSYIKDKENRWKMLKILTSLTSLALFSPFVFSFCLTILITNK